MGEYCSRLVACSPSQHQNDMSPAESFASFASGDFCVALAEVEAQAVAKINKGCLDR